MNKQTQREIAERDFTKKIYHELGILQELQFTESEFSKEITQSCINDIREALINLGMYEL